MESVELSLWWIPIIPLVGAAAAFLVGRVSRDLSGWVATLASALSGLVVYRFFTALPAQGAPFEERIFNWFNVGGLRVDFTLRFDELTAVMALVVTGVGSLIHLYAISYMKEDESRPRFFAYLNLFMFSMLLLVLGGNLLVLFVGWEGVGLCSYLLIGFWFRNLAFAKAGRKAFVVNRIGDAAFLIGLFLLYRNFGSLDFAALRAIIGAQPGLTALYSIIAVCLFVGATGKSAQIPLFVWLPDAMAGPTPVSALIHAATMVTAGVYMMARMHFLYDLVPGVMVIVALIAAATAFISATTALTQFDIKKVLAYSTISQLGFMFMAVSAGAYEIAIFHVVTHAFFKACLFLGAGSVIQGCHHEQDMRLMGGLWRKMPVTAATYLIATLAISGIVPFAGYYSKHAILLALETNTNPDFAFITHMLVALANLTAFCTAFYMARSFAMTFLGGYRGHAHPHESPWKMTSVLVALAILSAVGGVFLAEPLSHFLGELLGGAGEHTPDSVLDAVLHSWTGIAGVVLAVVFYTRLTWLPGAFARAFAPLWRLFSRRYYVDELYEASIVRPLEAASEELWLKADQGLIDRGVNGIAQLLGWSGQGVRRIQTGVVAQYALFMFLATVAIILIYLVR